MGRCSRARSLSDRSARHVGRGHSNHFRSAAPMESLDSEYTVFCTAWEPLVHSGRGRSCAKFSAAATEHCDFEYSGRHVGAEPTATEQWITRRPKHQQLSQSLRIAGPSFVQCVGLGACKRHASTCSSLAACLLPVGFRCCHQKASRSKAATAAM